MKLNKALEPEKVGSNAFVMYIILLQMLFPLRKLIRHQPLL